MKRFLSVAALVWLFLFSCTSSKEKTPDLLCVKQNGKWGYVNQQGKTVIPFQFDEAGAFAQDELALVKTEGKYGFINKKGKFVVDPELRDAVPFADGVAFIVKVGGAPTLINTSGKEIAVLEKAVKVHSFSEGLARFCISVKDEDDRFNELWGYIDTKGKIVIEPKYHNASDFVEGLAWGKNYETSESVVIDKKGKTVLDVSKTEEGIKIEKLSLFSEGLISFYAFPQRAYGFLNKSGKVVISCLFERAGGFSEGLSWASQTGIRLGFINKKGDFVIDEQFYAVGHFSSGLCHVTTDELWGYINKKGKFVIQPIFKEATPFHGDLAAVHDYHYDWGFIDKKGKYVIEPTYSDINWSTYPDPDNSDYLADTDYLDLSAVIPSFKKHISDGVYFGVRPDDGLEPFINSNGYDGYVWANGGGFAKFVSVSGEKIDDDIEASPITYHISRKYGMRPAIYPGEKEPQRFSWDGTDWLRYTYALSGEAKDRAETLAKALADVLREVGDSVKIYESDPTRDIHFFKDGVDIQFDFINHDNELDVQITFPTSFLPGSLYEGESSGEKVIDEAIDPGVMAFLEEVYPNVKDRPGGITGGPCTTDRFEAYEIECDYDPIYQTQDTYSADVLPYPKFTKYECFDNAYTVEWQRYERCETVRNIVVLVREKGKYLIDNIIIEVDGAPKLLFDYSRPPVPIYGD